MHNALYMKTTADACVPLTIKEILDFGMRVESPKDNSFELRNYQTGVSMPQARIMAHPARPLNIVVAVARFVWLVAGNNRVEDIAYYEPKVRGFSDNQLTVPGSDYGARLFEPRPGLNQIDGVIDRLAANFATRQAAAVVWAPEDAVRASRDIPCTFGMFFDMPSSPIKPPQLNMTTIMRSNNAFRILPFNLFEFTMLQECIASELNCETGSYTHWAASMHVYDNSFEWDATRRIADTEAADSILMPHMPFGDGLSQAREVARLEAELRHASNEKQLLAVMEQASPLHNYWLELLAILYCWGAAKRDYDVQYHRVNPNLRDMVQTACQKAYAD